MPDKATLDVLKKLEARKRRRVELNKSQVSHIAYQAELRRQLDRDNMKAEHMRIKAQLRSTTAWHPGVMRDRYEELTRALGEKG